MSVTYAYSGKLEKLTVTTAGVYDISAYGGQGGSGGYLGGLGAEESASVTLKAGEKLELIIGGVGQTFNNSGAGGGGGTFILANIGAGGAYVPLLVAGGGGGGGYQSAGGAGTATTPSGSGGGGTAGVANGYKYAGGGGAGADGNGGKAGYYGGTGGYAPAYGAVGGLYAGFGNLGRGGFGGGGGAGNAGPGGGGGFTGGDGGSYKKNVASTGGTSFAYSGATSVTGFDGVNAGDGKIVFNAAAGNGVTYLTPAALPTVNTPLVWDRSTGDFYDPSHWLTAANVAAGVYPAPGDPLTIASGVVSLIGSEAKVAGTFNDNAVTLGSGLGSTATLDLQSAVAGRAFVITVDGDAAVLATGGGVSDSEGSITAATSGATLTLGSVGGGALVFSTYGAVTVSNGENLVFTGDTTFANYHGFSIQNGSVTNDGTVDFVGGQGALFDGAVASDTLAAGLFNLEFGATVTFDDSVSSQETIAFNGAANDLVLDDLAGFSAAVTNFSSGNSIDFTKVTADGAFYDSVNHAIDLTNGGVTIATLDDVTAQNGLLTATPGAGGTGTLVSYANAESNTTIELSAADQAMGSNVVRDTLFVPGTATHITGAGVKIGIISDSFDLHGQEAANITAGYLPSGGVTVLEEGSSGEDEGQAMAELIHQVAPDAQLYFATGTKGQADFANNVQALQAAGCNIIVDDISYSNTAQFQVSGTIVNAVSAAVQGGVNYFTSAGNFSHSFYQGNFVGQTETLPDGSIVDANIFSNGTPYEAVNIAANTTPYIQVNWTAPYMGSNNQGAPDALTFKMFDASGNLIGTSLQSQDGVPTAASVLFTAPVSTAQTDYIAVYNSSGAALPAGFGFSLDVMENGAIETIDDPSANTGNGTVSGQELVPGVNTVGAIFYGQSAAFGQTPSANEGFSSYGPGELLYDSNGNPITPTSAGKVDFSAPDGVNVAVNGFAPFFGTSSGAPNAAAVAALMLQADMRLTNTQISYLLANTATAIADGSPAETGAGLVQAPGAVQAAITAATTPIWTAQGDGVNWSDAANWSDNATPGATDAVSITNGDGQLSGAYSSTDNVASATVQSLTVDGGVTTTPTLVIGGADMLEVTGGVVLTDTGSIDLQGSLKLDGAAIDGGNGGGITFDGKNDSNPKLTLETGAQPSGATFAETLDDFTGAATLDLAGLKYTDAGPDTLLTVVNDVLTVIENGISESFSLLNGLAQYYASSDGAGGTIVSTAPCYCPGSLVLTDKGEVAVEDLQIGDVVVTFSGEQRPIKWIGTRAYSARFARNNFDAHPVCFQTGSLAEGVPHRDLWVSPRHAMLLDGALIPAEALVNGVTITRPLPRTHVRYYHVELESHDVLVVNGAASESFLDEDSRGLFHNAGSYDALYANQGRRFTAAIARRVESGPVLDEVRRRLAVRAGATVPARSALDEAVALTL